VSQVADRLTPCSAADFYAVVRAVWPRVMPDADWSRQAGLLIVAHWALETGWGHGCHNYNVGNRKHVAGDPHDYCAFPHDEIIGGKEVWLDNPPRVPPQDPFVAYGSLWEGVTDYLTHLRAEFRAAWPYVLAGDAPGFCHALKLAGYYTASEERYRAGVVACMAAAEHAVPPDPGPAVAFVPPDTTQDTLPPDADA
jgi:hypothetical protein